MTYKKTSTHTKQQIRPSLLVVMLIVIIGLINHHALYAADGSSVEDTAKKPHEKNNALLISTETPNMSAEKDFDKVRGYESYDPITNTWSAIEAFKEVEILEDATQDHDENYIYYSFWAYDSIDHQWKRVDIREYGYKHAKHPSDVDQVITKKPKKKFEFWKNLGLTIAAGGGCTYYVNTVKDLDLFVRTGQKEFLLQTPPSGSSDTAQGKAHEIKWPISRTKRLNSINHDNVVTDTQSLGKAHGDISFHGRGFNIPVTLALHYTFFKKLRIGAGSNLEMNYLKKLYPHGDAKHIMEYEASEPWFYNTKFFGTVGYKVFQKGKHAVVVDTQLGVVYDYGNKKVSFQPWSFKNFEYIGFYASLGVAHEIKLNDFCKFFYRLSCQYKRYDNSSDFASVNDSKPSTSSIILWQPAVHLEIGTIFNFGRDKDSEDEEEDENIQVDESSPVASSNEGNLGSEASLTPEDANQVKLPATNYDESSKEADAAQQNETAPKEQPTDQQKDKDVTQEADKLLTQSEGASSKAEQAKNKAK